MIPPHQTYRIVQVVDCHYLSDFLCCEYSHFPVPSPPAAFLVVKGLVRQYLASVKDTEEVILFDLGSV